LNDKTTVTGTARVLVPQKPGETAQDFINTGSREMKISDGWLRSVVAVDETSAVAALPEDTNETIIIGEPGNTDFPNGLNKAQIESLDEDEQYTINYIDEDSKRQVFTGYPSMTTKKNVITYMFDNETDELRIDPKNILKVEIVK
jgi:hypothetical protein